MGIDRGRGCNRQNAVGQLIEPYQVSLCESLIPRHIDVVDDFFVIECVSARIGNHAVEKA
jgi:hypothetical protein